MGQGPESDNPLSSTSGTAIRPARARALPRSLQGRLGNLLLLTVSLVFSLACVELGLRVAGALNAPAQAAQPGPRDNEWVFFQYDPLLGWKNRPGAEGWFRIPDTRTHVRINAQGLRDVDHAYARQGKHRVLVLGDSFTWGFGVEEHERYTDRLAALLGDSVEIINTGVSGYGTDQELLYYQVEGFRYHPEVVLLEFVTNDLTNNVNAVQYTYPKPHFLLRDGKLVLMNVPVPARSVAWEERFATSGLRHSEAATVPTAARRLKGSLREYLVSYGFVADRIKSLAVYEGWMTALDPLTAALILELNREVLAHDAKLAVLLAPDKRVAHGGRQPELAALAEFLRAHGVQTIDLRPAFLSEVRRGRQLFFAVDQHWNAVGHDTAAAAIYRYLVGTRLISANGVGDPREEGPASAARHLRHRRVGAL